MPYPKQSDVNNVQRLEWPGAPLFSGQLPHQEASQQDPFDEHRSCLINEGKIRGYRDFFFFFFFFTSPNSFDVSLKSSLEMPCFKAAHARSKGERAGIRSPFCSNPPEDLVSDAVSGVGQGIPCRSHQMAKKNFVCHGHQVRRKDLIKFLLVLRCGCKRSLNLHAWRSIAFISWMCQISNFFEFTRIFFAKWLDLLTYNLQIKVFSRGGKKTHNLYLHK